MKIISAYKIIKNLGATIFRTSDVAITMDVTNKQGYKVLKQLADEKLLLHLRRDLWAITEALDPLMLADYLTAPLPAYISLQSALYYHGLISQIPSVIYAVSIARTRVYKTPVASYSIHHISAELFAGFDIIGDKAIRIAQPEKALFDFFYFKAAKSKLFYALPELDIPNDFNWNILREYAEKIVNKSRRIMVLNLIERQAR